MTTARGDGGDTPRQRWVLPLPSPIPEHELPADIRKEVITQDHVRLEYEREMERDYAEMRFSHQSEDGWT